MSEQLYEVKYGMGTSHYVVEKETTEETHTIIIYDIRKEKREICRIEYNNIGEEYQSPFLSWYNLLFCSCEYGPSPDYVYMNQAVQNGMKTAATVYFAKNSVEGEAYMATLPEHCHCRSYEETMIFAYREGSISDYFDIDYIEKIYIKHGVANIDWLKVRKIAEMPMEQFGDPNICGYNLQTGGNCEQTIINGLLLGYLY